eukprot:14010436-Ditylum_brightwellii.AAC.1
MAYTTGSPYGLWNHQNRKNKISHLLYIDDLKLYARNEEELRRALKFVENFSGDINMTFGLDKCAILLI